MALEILKLITVEGIIAIGLLFTIVLSLVLLGSEGKEIAIPLGTGLLGFLTKSISSNIRSGKAQGDQA